MKQPSASSSGGGRVPASLQALFIIANTGKEIDKAPPNKMGMKTFRRKRVPTEKTGEVRETSGELEKSHRRRNRISPHAYLTSLLKKRGYCTEEFQTIESAYYNKPTPLQLASYGKVLLKHLRGNDESAMRKLFETGVSPSACNKHSESIVHMVSRLGLHGMLRLLLEHGASVQISDDYGRTPLHDACWAEKPNFTVVDLLLEQDAHLFYMKDCKGFFPLQYIQDENWTVWTKYLMSRKDIFWPDRAIKTMELQEKPPLAMLPPHSRPAANPAACTLTTLEAIAVAAKGEFHDFTSEDENIYDGDEDVTSDDCSIIMRKVDADYHDDDDGSVMTFDEDEMAEILWDGNNASFELVRF